MSPEKLSCESLPIRFAPPHEMHHPERPRWGGKIHRPEPCTVLDDWNRKVRLRTGPCVSMSLSLSLSGFRRYIIRRIYVPDAEIIQTHVLPCFFNFLELNNSVLQTWTLVALPWGECRVAWFHPSGCSFLTFPFFPFTFPWGLTSPVFAPSCLFLAVGSCLRIVTVRK